MTSQNAKRFWHVCQITSTIFMYYKEITDHSWDQSKRMWAQEMYQWLRALAAIAEDLGSVPITHMAFHNRL